MQNKQEALDNILDYFDFNLASEMMRLNDCFAVNRQDDCERVAWLRRLARELYSDCYDSAYSNTDTSRRETAGLSMCVEVTPLEGVFAKLDFVGCSHDNYWG